MKNNDGWEIILAFYPVKFTFTEEPIVMDDFMKDFYTEILKLTDKEHFHHA
jgi:hypothetical protein